MLGVSSFTQVKEGIRSSDLRERSKIKEAVLYAKQLKISWVGHVMRMSDSRWARAVSEWIPCGVKRTAGWTPTRWSEFFTNGLEERYDAPWSEENPLGYLCTRQGKMEDLLARARVTR
ncbi:unnamed protein product [Angiostrongylus costaricensis]|uniref:PAPS_reduct domain-containing protein n=1 Tax=Angiostrongylus costaricensis TaxID=334426 RepID=A0A0R3PWX7_ANGCS|nr:unnamed protein product [Angiostrongylus costaricensis]